MKMKEEMVDVVDESDKVIGKATRAEADAKVLRLRGSRVIIFNNKKEILIQKRASIRARYADYWDFGVAETLMRGESYESAAIRGLMEEAGIIGISNFDIKFLFKLKYSDKETKRWYKVYSLVYNGVVHKDDKEVSETKFVTEKELDRLLEFDRFIPQGLAIWKKYKELSKEGSFRKVQ